jgi:hypothetical protein
MTVNKERVQLLVNALRSGDYIQGFGALEYEDPNDKKVKNCCLGVACRVAQKHGSEVVLGSGSRLPVGSKFADYVTFDNSDAYLPERVRNWFGFALSSPVLQVNNRNHLAAYVNDTRKYNLRDIADAFERTYLMNETI